MQLLMGALFGILGVLFADPILATLKVVLVDLSRREAREEAEAPEVVAPAERLLLRAALPLRCRCIIAAPPRTIFRTCTSNVEIAALGGSPAAAGPFAEGRALAAW